ncbi:hypothetical protein ACFT0G_19150 [Streptomyces sp. NPDC057020]|uniref:hypothetical protein n=1 Tax=unclassified Streptomyces TaxID=2593676 RepID=UPI00363ACEBB
MTLDVRRTRPLQHVTATGTALAVALGPVVVGALLARSVGGDPMASVNALIAGGGQRARISSAQLRSGALRRSSAQLRSGALRRSGARLRARATRGAARPLRLRTRATRGAVRPPRRGALIAPVRRLARTVPLRRSAGSAARFARQEEALRRHLPGARPTHPSGRL